jgi:hypothetical protein
VTFQRRLLGRSRQAAVGTTAVAASLFVCLFTLQTDPLAGVLDSLGGGVGTGNLLFLVPAIVLVLASYHAYRYDGLLVCVAVAHLVVLAWVLPLLVWGTVGPDVTLVEASGVLVACSLLLAGTGYALGRLAVVTVGSR